MKEIASALAERKKNSAHSEMIRRLRLANLRKLLRDRNGPILPDDDAGREYLVELLLPISVGPHADIKMPNAIEVWAPWMQKDEAGQLIDHVNRMPIWERKPSAKVLGRRLNLTNPDRERLKLWTIAPSDMGEKGMAWWRKHKDRNRKRRLRQRTPRSEYLAAHNINRDKPWKIEGISRAKWYRRHHETGVSEVKLKGRGQTCLTSEAWSQRGRGGRGTDIPDEHRAVSPTSGESSDVSDRNRPQA